MHQGDLAIGSIVTLGEHPWRGELPKNAPFTIRDTMHVCPFAHLEPHRAGGYQYVYVLIYTSPIGLDRAYYIDEDKLASVLTSIVPPPPPPPRETTLHVDTL